MIRDAQKVDWRIKEISISSHVLAEERDRITYLAGACRAHHHDTELAHDGSCLCNRFVMLGNGGSEETGLV